MKKKGYTIAELIIAILLLTIFLMLNTTIYTAALRNVKDAERLSTAMGLAIQKVEEIQGMEFDDIQGSYNTEGNYTVDEYNPFEGTNEIYSVKVEIIPEANSEKRTIDIQENGDLDVFKTVKVTVYYTVGGKEDYITLSCLKVNENVINSIYNNGSSGV